MMMDVTRSSPPKLTQWATVAALLAVAGSGCRGNVGNNGPTTTELCANATDSNRVVAPQRLVRLTRMQVVNTIGALFGDGAAMAIFSNTNFSDISDETGYRFPPAISHGEAATISSDADSAPMLADIAAQGAQYVFDNFAAVTGCSNATDACATSWLSTLAGKAFRRPVTSGEQGRLMTLYGTLKSQMVNGWPVTATVQEATQSAVNAILISPQMLWRSELGDPSKMSNNPPGIPLTDYELASLLSYYLTNGPPDAMLLQAAAGGNLKGNLASQTARLLQTPAAQNWLSEVMFVYYRLNLLYNARPDPTKFPAATTATLVNMHDESKMFLNNVLWNLTLKDILLSRTTFVNTNLATNIYQIPVPGGASDTNFVQATLPSDQRSGIITNAAYITSRAGADRESVVQRALLIKDTLLCLSTPPPPAEVLDQVAAARAAFDQQTAQQQVAFRAITSPCNGCHGHFDMYGLVLDEFDNIAKLRTTVTLSDGMGGTVVKPVDPHTTMPPELGGGPVANAVDMAQQLAQSDYFTNCLARNVLQYAMSEFDTSNVDVGGCATIELAQKYNAASGQTFTDLVNAAVTTPAFTLRNPQP